MSLGSIGGREAALGAAVHLLAVFGTASSRQMCSRSDGPDWTELAVEKLAGLLAVATGVGLFGPLVIAARRGEAEGVGAAVVGVLGTVTLVAGVALLLGGRSADD